MSIQTTDPFAEGHQPPPAPKEGFTFEHVSFLPKPEVIESNSEEAWAEWDEAVSKGQFA